MDTRKIVLGLGVECESLFTLFSVPSWIWSCFCVNREKISFSRSDFVVSEIAIWRLISLTNIYKRVYILFKKRHASDCQKKISFVQIIHLKFTFLTLDDIGISKLVSQLKLLSSLFEFKDMIWAPLLKNCKIKKKYLKNKRYAL